MGTRAEKGRFWQLSRAFVAFALLYRWPALKQPIGSFCSLRARLNGPQTPSCLLLSARSVGISATRCNARLPKPRFLVHEP